MDQLLEASDDEGVVEGIVEVLTEAAARVVDETEVHVTYGALLLSRIGWCRDAAKIARARAGYFAQLVLAGRVVQDRRGRKRAGQQALDPQGRLRDGSENVEMQGRLHDRVEGTLHYSGT